MTSWLALTPVVAAWAGCFWLCRELAGRQKILSDWRLSVALSTALWGATLTFIVESLNLARALNQLGLLTAWLLADAILFLAAIKLAHQRETLRPALLWAKIKEAPEALNRLPLFAKCCWAGVSLIVLFLFFVAALTPTTNWDSLTYHLPRVMHWLQQQSVEHFPTEDPRQIEFGPWAAFVQANLFSLAGTDRLVNLPQWFAMALTVLLLSLFVELLAQFCGFAWASEQTPAAHLKRQNAGALAALIGSTIPMGMMQAMTPQTDYVTTFWIVCLHLFALALFLHPVNRMYLLGAAVSFGLGFLTKSTALIYAAPLGAFGLVWLISRRSEPLWKLKTAATFSVVVLLLNAPHGFRNDALFGSPMGSRQMQVAVRNGRITPGTIASNFIRNLSLHNNCGIRPVTRALNRGTLALHSLTGEKLDDPRTTFGEFTPVESLVVYEDYASASLHVLAFLLALIWAFREPRRNTRLLGYAGSLLASVLFFVMLLKYQHWNSRFHLAYLILSAPLIAIVFIDATRRWLHLLLPVALFGYALVCLRVNEARPIFHPRFASLSRESQYLDIHASQWTAPLQCITDEIVASGCKRVGLKLGFDAFEYPIWIMLRNRGFTGRIDHYYVEHVSSRLRAGTPAPCAIIARESEPPPQITNSYPYRVVHSPLMILWSEKPPPPCQQNRPQ